MQDLCFNHDASNVQKFTTSPLKRVCTLHSTETPEMKTNVHHILSIGPHLAMCILSSVVMKLFRGAAEHQLPNELQGRLQ